MILLVTVIFASKTFCSNCENRYGNMIGEQYENPGFFIKILEIEKNDPGCTQEVTLYIKPKSTKEYKYDNYFASALIDKNFYAHYDHTCEIFVTSYDKKNGKEKELSNEGVEFRVWNAAQEFVYHLIHRYKCKIKT